MWPVALYAIFGLVVGSFLNVCIYRIPRGKFFSSARSYCPHCGHTLQWYELIPLFSFLGLRGRCRVCHERISVRYPLVEAGNALLWVLCFVQYGFGWYSILLAVVFSLLLVIACIDLDIMEIPNGLSVALLIVGIAPFVASFFEGSGLPYALPWWGYLVGIVAASVPLFLLALLTRGGIGGGDIKLMAAIGLFAGWQLTLLGALLGLILGGVAGVVQLVAYGRNKRAMMPLAPFLALGMVVSLLWGGQLLALIF